MKKVLVIWTWGQWEKYINYFIKNNYMVYWVCKTNNTKNKIENKYNIPVLLDYEKLNLEDFNIIIVSLPPEIQWQVSISILKKRYRNKLIIEIPISWDENEVEEIKKYDNVYFFLEEYYTLLSIFLRKINIKDIWNINIDIFTNKEDYDNLKAREVTYIHINNNFLWLNLKNITYHFNFHDNENIYYDVSFNYKWKLIHYKFNKEKYLKLWDKKIVDNYNFDNILSKILQEENNFNKYYYIKNVW